MTEVFMKLIIVLLTLFLCSPVFADVVGTWAYSGSGCRNSSLDTDSHVSKAPVEGPEEAIFIFRDNGTAEMTSVFTDGEESREESQYALNGNNLVLSDWPEAELTLKDDRILIFLPDEETTCSSGQRFVYILAPVD